MKVQFVKQAKNQIIIDTVEGKISEKEAASQLRGLTTLTDVVLTNSKSEAVKAELNELRADLEAAADKFDAE